MDASSFRPGESHVAQRSRRDKLRVQASSTSVHQLDDFHNNLEQLLVHSGLNPELVQVRNVRKANVLYDPTTTTVFSSEMLNFASTSNNVLLAQGDAAMIDHELDAVQSSRLIPEISSYANTSHPISSNFNASPRASPSDPQGYTNWRSNDSQQSYDCMVNYASGSVGRKNNQKPIFVGDVLSNNARVTNSSTPAQYLKPNYNGYQNVESSLANPSSEIHVQDSQKHHTEMKFPSNMHPLYQNTLVDVVTSAASIGGNERILLPAYGNQSTPFYFDNANSSMNRPVDNSHLWSSELGFIARKNDQELRTLASDPNTQVLSLSLSSNPPSRGNLTQFGEGYESANLQSKSSVLEEPHQDSKLVKSNYLCPMSKPVAINSKGSGKSIKDLVGVPDYNVIRNAGPLGPFTGYATILTSSRFLNPAQQLLDEFCSATGSKFKKACEGSGGMSEADAETGTKGNTNSSSVSSMTFYRSNEASGDVAVASSSCESYRPEYQQKKAKLLYLQEEVCRRYKQYHQQMQMVASSFESVAGLSAATPYVSLALKTISKNFRFLKHAISDQLKHVIKALGEDLLSPNTNASSSKGDTSTSRLRCMDPSFQRNKSSGANVGFFEPQQHIWRPQRGLPERSVAILRAWLFEHFLHPYPTDTDKHMLAAQTGLSRSQVSNWFINARVRLWKPMVEEMHMLETKGLAENQTCMNNLEGKRGEGTSQPYEQPSNNTGASSMLNKQMECSGTVSSDGSGEKLEAEQWSREKRSRIEFQDPTRMDGAVMDFLPYQSSGIEVGGLGVVSLTLELRHGVENAHHHQQQQQQQQQRQLQLQQHEDQLRLQFGGQMIHDFVGCS